MLRLVGSIGELIDSQQSQNNDPEDRFLTDGFDWQEYEKFLLKIGDNPRYRVSYLDGVLEVLSPSLRHESAKKRIGELLLVYFLETETEYYSKGSTTFRKEQKRGGTEADESYCIGIDKEFPDLVIEVVVTSGGLSKLELYSRLLVREVWFWQNECFSIYSLQEESQTNLGENWGYERRDHSLILPELDVEVLATYMGYPNSLLAVKEFQQYLRGKS